MTQREAGDTAQIHTDGATTYSYEAETAHLIYEARAAAAQYASNCRYAYQQLWHARLQQVHRAEVRMRRASKRAAASGDKLDVYIRRRDTVRRLRDLAEAAEQSYLSMARTTRAAMEASNAAYHEWYLMTHPPQTSGEPVTED